MAENYFKTLYDIDVTNKVSKKNGLSYVSWASAWAEVKKVYPEAFYTIYEKPDGVNYFTDGRTCWVKTGVTIHELEHIEYLPIMDFKNKSIPFETVTSADVNKSIQRSLTKACARHGLGLYIYEGEDLPESTVEIKDVNAESLKLATEKSKKSEDLKTKVGTLCRTYTESDDPNPNKIKDLEKAKELNKKLKELK